VTDANRFRGTTADGHVESYFLRANHPDRPLALWIKATVLFPRRGPRVQESWCIVFAGERAFARKVTAPFSPSFAVGDVIEAPGARWSLGDRGSCRGAMEGASWDLAWTRADGPIGDPLSIYPSRWLLDGPFPRSKLLTPHPALTFSGHVEALGERFAVDGWRGMQGHNWGREHAFEYAWGQCFFPGGGGAPDAWVEGFSGRVRLGPATSPRLSALVVRRGAETLRFDRLFDAWRQEAAVGERSWRVSLRGPAGRATLEMDAAGRPMVCLGYANPDGALAYCTNSKLARTRLVVEPARGDRFTLESPHGGALEILRRDRPPGEVV
jgi:hypothetical protein